VLLRSDEKLRNYIQVSSFLYNGYIFRAEILTAKLSSKDLREVISENKYRS
jgi:hypothetical protein